MTQEERRLYLIRVLQSELPQYGGIPIPPSETEQRQLIRSMMNVRPPMPPRQGFLEVQDAYLSEEVRARGIVDGNSLEPVSQGGRICLWQGDITRLRVGAVVNAANSALLGCFIPQHTCIDNIIHSFAGIQLRLACNEIMQAQGHEEETGKAKITPAFNLPCEYVIHTVGPIVQGPLTKKHEEFLSSCYRSCLELAVEYELTSIAFCCISTGVFRFPNKRAAEIAVKTVMRYLEESGSGIKVIFNVFKDEDLDIYKKLLKC